MKNLIQEVGESSRHLLTTQLVITNMAVNIGIDRPNC